MIFLVDYETAKIYSYITLVLLVAIPVFIYLVYLNGQKKKRRRQG